MPADPLSPLTPGQPFPTAATTWNPVFEVARDRRQPPRPDTPATGQAGASHVEGLALNNTGAPLPRYHPAAVVGTGGIDLGEDRPCSEWAKRPVVTLDVPTGSTDVIAVALEDIPDGKFGRVAVAGWAACLVDVSDSGHEYASPTTNTDALVSGSAGTVRIINTGTGTARRCAVLLGGQSAGGGGGTLTTSNTDETEESTTTRLEFDKTRGVQVEAGATDADPDVVSGIAADTDQMGMVGVGHQTWSGSKFTTGGLATIVSVGWNWGASTPGRTDGLIDEPFGYSAPGVGGVGLAGGLYQVVFGQATAITAGEMPVGYTTWSGMNVFSGISTHPMAPDAHGGHKSVVIAGHGASFRYAGVGGFPVFQANAFAVWDLNGANNGSVYTLAPGLRVGIDTILDLGDYWVHVCGGIIWKIEWVGSPPAPPTPVPGPPTPGPPPPPGAGILSGFVTSGSPAIDPAEGREVILDSSTTVTTDSAGFYLFGDVSAGSHTVLLETLTMGEFVANSVDGGGFDISNLALVTTGASEAHTVDFITDGGSVSPPPAPPAPPVPPAPVPPAPPVPPP